MINVEGGKLNRLTTEPSEDTVPSWSRDGRWIYFCSNRGGTDQIWKIPAEGGEPVQVTRQGGFEPSESPDGKFIYYHKGGGIWRMPVDGGEEARILEGVEWGYWAVTEQGICYLDRKASPRPSIELYNFATNQVTRLATVEQGPNVIGPPGFAVSHDGRHIIYKRVDQVDNDIMLVANFR